MMPYKNWICNYRPYRVPVKLADHRIILKVLEAFYLGLLKMENIIEMKSLLKFYMYLHFIIIFFLCYI